MKRVSVSSNLLALTVGTVSNIRFALQGQAAELIKNSKAELPSFLTETTDEQYKVLNPYNGCMYSNLEDIEVGAVEEYKIYEFEAGEDGKDSITYFGTSGKISVSYESSQLPIRVSIARRTNTLYEVSFNDRDGKLLGLEKFSNSLIYLIDEEQGSGVASVVSGLAEMLYKQDKAYSLGASIVLESMKRKVRKLKQIVKEDEILSILELTSGQLDKLTDEQLEDSSDEVWNNLKLFLDDVVYQLIQISHTVSQSTIKPSNIFG